MRFFDKIRSSFASFMAGRYGADQLGMTMLWTALILSVVGSFSRVGLLTLMADALLLLMFWRMLSKDRLKRQHENQTYLQKTYGARKAVTEWINRVKNGKKYRYFTCPQCKKRLRVPRGVGNITITCKGCGNKFDKKA
ncbi:MAG: hypothetical protein SPD88_00435 [Candidatus Ventricola sp.]|nr:hypothetical protein [Candidatus Ventricola sp.]MDY4541250.1 hypothetical protein [Candidatus Ventricola sp.]